MPSEEIQHISDTALLVAAARAAETQREDALVSDPYAARLAGERGIALAQSGSPSRWLSFGIGLRSRFIDEFLMAEVRAHSVDCVACLGAGLDARPWRLDLPEHLRWIEVDFTAILDYKHSVLKDVTPRCRLEQISVDLNDSEDRLALLDELPERGSRILLLTEGLLFYLPAETVRALAEETVARAWFHSWILEVAPASDLLRARHSGSIDRVMGMRAATSLEGAQVAEAVAAAGWFEADKKTFAKDGVPFAIERMKRNGWKPDPNVPKPLPEDPAGVWLFRKSA